MRKFLQWLRENSKFVLNNKGILPVMLAAGAGSAMLPAAAGAAGTAAATSSPWWLPAAISGGAGLLGSFFGSDDDDTQETYSKLIQTLTQAAPEWVGGPSPEQFAEFPEAEAARKQWWSSLQEWGGQPGYGAIAPDWGDIWDEASTKINQYYWGGPGGQPGLAGKVRSSAAARGVSESPALETELTNLGYQQGADISKLATDEAYQKALFSEQGRQNWLSSLMGLTGIQSRYYQPQGTFYTPSQTTQTEQWGTQTMPTSGGGVGNLIGGLGNALAGAYSQKQQQDWYSGLLKDILG